MTHTWHSITVKLTNELHSCTELARFEAMELIKAVTGASAAQLHTAPDTPLPAHQATQLDQLVTRRRQGESLAHVLGHWDFYGLTLTITHDTLAPRPETEQMVAWILENFSSQTPLTALDLGTGSGAIALALATARPTWQLVASDLSAAALAVAKANAQQHHLSTVTFVLGNWFTPITQTADLIISNPPYLQQDEPHWQQLRGEPRLALDGGPDGLAAYRPIISAAPDYINRGGHLILEHGYQQAQAITHLLAQHGWQAITTYQDLAGLDRFTCARAA